MKTIIYLLLIIAPAFYCELSFGQNNHLIMINPQTWRQSAGSISGMNMEVTPQGIYARVDLTFTLNVKDPYYSGDQIEGILNFDLPAGSFIHDSWLWLDSTTIISADLVERKMATQIYTSIVRRRQDPSLLINTLPSNYRLNVYPIRSDYPRKVKITYSTPFIWKGGQAVLNLPLNINRVSTQQSPVSLVVHTDSVFGQPGFLNHSFQQYAVAYTSSTYSFLLPDSVYGNADFNLVFNTPAAGRGLLYQYPVNSGQGVYQLMLPESTSSPSRGNVVFIVDPSNKMAYTVPQLRNMIQNALWSDLSSTDSFNIFYTDGSLIKRAGTTWLAADSVHTNVALAGLSGINPSPLMFIPLLKEALEFSAAGQGNTKVILLGSNEDYHQSSKADSIVQYLHILLGGFTRKIHVINNHQDATANSALYQKLAQVSGGSYYRNSSVFFDEYTRVTSVDLDIPGMLRQILYDMGPGRNGYQVTLPLNGIVTDVAEPLFPGKFSPAHAYLQTGVYYGSFQDTGRVELTYTSGAGLQTARVPLMGIYKGDGHTYKSWMFNSLRQMKANGAIMEIIDSCISNRLLFDYTAFLALETGDTIKDLTDRELPRTIKVSEMGQNLNDLRVFPNPFSQGLLTIQCPEEIRTLQILDLTGRLIFESSPGDRTAYWDGTNINGQTVSSGIYLVVATNKAGKRYVAKCRRE